MRSFNVLVAVSMSVSALACGAHAQDTQEPVDTTDDAVVASTPVDTLDVTLYKSPDGLQGCEAAELVTGLHMDVIATQTWPTTILYSAKLSQFYAACPGLPVPALIVPGPTVTLKRVELGCGNRLFRGTLPTGGTLEVFDYRAGRPGCGIASENKVIVKKAGEFLYSAKPPVACESLQNETECLARPDCRGQYAYQGNEVPTYSTCATLPVAI